MNRAARHALLASMVSWGLMSGCNMVIGLDGYEFDGTAGYWAGTGGAAGSAGDAAAGGAGGTAAVGTQAGDSCASGYGDCNGDKLADGCETPLNTTSNCGNCGKTCAAGQTCDGVQCVGDAGAG